MYDEKIKVGDGILNECVFIIKDNYVIESKKIIVLSKILENFMFYYNVIVV